MNLFMFIKSLFPMQLGKKIEKLFFTDFVPRKSVNEKVT